jgi:hypothetical protein
MHGAIRGPLRLNGDGAEGQRRGNGLECFGGDGDADHGADIGMASGIATERSRAAHLVLAGERRIECPIGERLNQIESILRAENLDRRSHCSLKDRGEGGDLNGSPMVRLARQHGDAVRILADGRELSI